MNEHERPVVTEVNKTAVRAGSTGHKVRYVLIASCAWSSLPSSPSHCSSSRERWRCRPPAERQT